MWYARLTLITIFRCIDFTSPLFFVYYSQNLSFNNTQSPLPKYMQNLTIGYIHSFSRDKTWECAPNLLSAWRLLIADFQNFTGNSHRIINMTSVIIWPNFIKVDPVVQIFAMSKRVVSLTLDSIKKKINNQGTTITVDYFYHRWSFHLLFELVSQNFIKSIESNSSRKARPI